MPDGVRSFGHRSAVFKTICFVVIDTTQGRTTFVNTLCGKKVLQGRDDDDPTNAHLEEGVRIKPITVG